MIKRIETVSPVCVDSVYDTKWVVGEGGIYEIIQEDVGVIITVRVSKNVTCVPWSNIRYMIAEID